MDADSRPGYAAVAIDVGASGLRGALVDAAGGWMSPVRLSGVPRSAAALVDAVVALVDELREDRRVSAIGIGVPGLVTWPEGALGFAGNHRFGDTPLRALVEERVGLRTVVDNDANCAAWGLSARAGSTGTDLLFLAIGTGLGSGLVTDGRVFRGRGGRGAEIGHVRVGRGTAAASGRLCGCGMRGCLEQTASGTALALQGRELVGRKPRGALARAAGGSDVTAKQVIDTARAGDQDCQALVDRLGRVLGRAIADEILPIFDVPRVVVGGGVAAAGPLLVEPLQEICEKRLAAHNFITAPDIEAVGPEEHPVLVGAGLLAHAAAADRDLALPWLAAPRPVVVDRRPPAEPVVPRTVLHISPHPDDETIGAACTLLGLKESGYRVVNLAVGLGRKADRARRKAELESAMAVAGFELAVPDEPVGISGADDLQVARQAISALVTGYLDDLSPDVVIGPHPFDGHHGHETVALGMSDSLGCRADPALAWWMWAIWSELPRPTMISPCTDGQLALGARMLDCYRGENARNDYRAMLGPARAVNAARGVEQVFGYGATAMPGITHAELLTEVRNASGRWQIGPPRVRAAEPLADDDWVALKDWRELLGTRGPMKEKLRHRSRVLRSMTGRAAPARQLARR